MTTTIAPLLAADTSALVLAVVESPAGHFVERDLPDLALVAIARETLARWATFPSAIRALAGDYAAVHLVDADVGVYPVRARDLVAIVQARPGGRTAPLVALLTADDATLDAVLPIVRSLSARACTDEGSVRYTQAIIHADGTIVVTVSTAYGPDHEIRLDQALAA